MFKSKKAESENWMPDTVLFYVIFVFIVGATMIAFIVLVNGFFFEKSNVSIGIKKSLFIDRFSNSPSCPTVYDAAFGATSPLVIDTSRLNQATLVQCYPSISTQKKAFQFTITTKEKKTLYATTANWDSTLGVVSREPLRKIIVTDGKENSLADLSIEVQNDK